MSTPPPTQPPRDEFRDRLRRGRDDNDADDQLETGSVLDEDELSSPRTSGGPDMNDGSDQPPKIDEVEFERESAADPARFEVRLPDLEPQPGGGETKRSARLTAAPALPVDDPGGGGGWPAWAIVDWDELEGGGKAPSDGSRAPSIPPTPQEFEEIRDQIRSVGTPEAAVEDATPLTSSTSITSARPTADAAADVIDVGPPTGPVEGEEPDEDGTEADEGRPSVVDTASLADEPADGLRAELVSRESSSAGSDLSLSPQRLWELVKEAAWAAQEARERAARAEGEAEVLRRELERLHEDRRNLTEVLAGGASGTPEAIPRRRRRVFRRRSKP